MTQSIAWTIAGSDSGGGAGIQADLHTFQDFGVLGATVITAITAQNSVAVTAVEACSPAIIDAQLQALAADLPAAAIKLGMLFDVSVMQVVSAYLETYAGTVICDPVMISTTGSALLTDAAKIALINTILPHATLMTPNVQEAQAITGMSLDSIDAVLQCAKQLQAINQAAVLIKGAYQDAHYCHDYFLDTHTAFWICAPRLHNTNTHGTGCTLSAAVAACVAKGFSLTDAVVLGKQYVHAGIAAAKQYGQGPGPVAHVGSPSKTMAFPWMVPADTQPLRFLRSEPFPTFMPLHPIYALIDNVDDLQRLIAAGLRVFQLRIKNKPLSEVETVLARCLAITRKHHAVLLVNDYWEMAIALKADGVHLGQDDLVGADVARIQAAGLLLGITAHSVAEVAIAHRFSPSYIGYGPVFHTQTKQVNAAPQGLAALQEICALVDYPVVAIGGIDWPQVAAVLGSGAASVAMHAALSKTLFHSAKRIIPDILADFH